MEDFNKLVIPFSSNKPSVEELNKLQTILIVDDDPVTCFLQSNLIREMGYKGQLQEAYHAEAALSFLKEMRPQEDADKLAPMLILLDINMPFIDGFEFLDKLASAKEISKNNINVSILTTSINKPDASKASDLAITSIILKPLTEQKLKQLLASLALD